MSQELNPTSPMSDQEEWVDWVDAQNQVLMAVPRSRVRREVR